MSGRTTATNTKDEIVQSINYLEYYEAELGQSLKSDSRGWATALCPFHADTNPSLGIDIHTGIFNCPGCGAKGDVISFHKKKHGCDFKTALIELGIIAGVKGTRTIPGKQKGERPGGNQSTQKAKITTVYDYHAANGSLLFQVCRFSPKDFRQRRPDGQNGHIWNLQGITPVLYHLPQTLAADQVIVVEGEKDVDNLAALQDIGVVATTCPMGAGKWRKSYTEALRGKNIIVIPDNDEPGQKHAVQVATALYGVAKSIKLLALPGLPEGGDMSDFIARYDDPLVAVSTLMALIDEAPAWKPGEKDQAKQNEIDVDETRLHLTDMGNARRMALLHQKNIRYDHVSKTWYLWDEGRWRQDDTGEKTQMAKFTVRAIYQEAAKIIDDDDRRKSLVSHALKSESDNRIKAMLSLAQSEPGIPITQKQFDCDLWLLNCQNGTINLRTGILRRHERADYITKMVSVKYVPDAQSVLWDNFLRRALPDDEVRAFVQRAAGYSLTGDVGEEVLFFLYGPPATGKTTFLRAIEGCLGDYAATTDFETLIVNKNRNGPRNDIARLAGRRFVSSVEVEDGRRLAESLINQLTGGEIVTARFMYQESFEFIPQFKLWLAANNQPRISGIDGAIWRRILQIPFDIQIPKEERDHQLKIRLHKPQETAAILNWLIEGCLAWQREGLSPPKAVLAATEDYRTTMDPLEEFITDYCLISPEMRVKNTDIWNAYQRWCASVGEKYPLGHKKFSQALFARGFDQYREPHDRFWLGIGLIF